MNLPRIVGSLEDFQHAHNHETKIENESNAHAAAIVTSARDSRNKKRSFQNAQSEDAEERYFIEKNTIVNLKFLHECFPKVNSWWDIQLLSNVIVR